MIRKALIAALLPLAACETIVQADEPDETPTIADKDMLVSGKKNRTGDTRLGGTVIGHDGSEIGTLNLTGSSNGVLIEVLIEEGSLTPGWHGLHLHQVGDCSDIGTFTRSGGHVGMLVGGHGLLNPKGPEAGDLPNIWAGADGAAGYEAFSTLFELRDLLDEDGTALIIHEARDDHRSQPIGGAGGRVACAVIQ